MAMWSRKLSGSSQHSLHHNRRSYLSTRACGSIKYWDDNVDGRYRESKDIGHQSLASLAHKHCENLLTFHISQSSCLSHRARRKKWGTLGGSHFLPLPLLNADRMGALSYPCVVSRVFCLDLPNRATHANFRYYSTLGKDNEWGVYMVVGEKSFDWQIVAVISIWKLKTENFENTFNFWLIEWGALAIFFPKLIISCFTSSRTRHNTPNIPR